MMGRKILIAVDGSRHCERALEWYAENLRNPEDQLVFAYNVEPPPLTLGAGLANSVTSDVYTHSLNEAVQSAKTLAAQTQAKCQQLGLVNSMRFIERMTTSPGAALVDIANEENVNLIVMGNRGVGTLRRTFMGSVSDFVLHHAHRPIAIVPPPKSH